MSGNLPYTYDEIEKRRVELIDGKVVTSPWPGINPIFVRFNISLIFGNYLWDKTPLPIPCNTYLYLDENNHYIPDFMVVCDPNKIGEDGVYGTPDFVAEVLSPGTVRNDKTVKKDAYARCGVKEYWLVSPNDKYVEVYRNDGGTFLLHDLYPLYADWQLAQMSDEERARVVTHFKCSLFDDLLISLDDIFYRTI